MKGTVLCHCGGYLISNSGKVSYNYKTNKIQCSNCHIEYNSDYIYNIRRENEIVEIKDRPKKLYFKVYQDKYNIEGNTYIDTIENILNILPDWINECKECNSPFPVLEPFEMDEIEFKNLPEFIGY